jgi:hypothetical protein
MFTDASEMEHPEEGGNIFLQNVDEHYQATREQHSDL